MLPQSGVSLSVNSKPVITEGDIVNVELVQVDLGKCLLFNSHLRRPETSTGFQSSPGSTARDDGERRYGRRATARRSHHERSDLCLCGGAGRRVAGAGEQFEKEFGRDAAGTRAERMMAAARVRVAVAVRMGWCWRSARRGAERLQLYGRRPAPRGPTASRRHNGCSTPGPVIPTPEVRAVSAARAPSFTKVSTSRPSRATAGESLSIVFAAMTGGVRYVSTAAGEAVMGAMSCWNIRGCRRRFIRFMPTWRESEPGMRPGIEVSAGRLWPRWDTVPRLYDSDGPLASSF